MREKAISRPWFFSPDPLLVMFTISVAAGLFLLLAGERLGFRATYSGMAMPLEAAPDFRLTDQFGNERSLGQFRGGPVVLSFLYTTCTDTCPTIADNLKSAYKALGRDAAGVTFLAVSVDPEGDTVEAARAFAEKHGPPQEWYYLTGSREELSSVWRDYNIGVLKPESAGHGDGDSHDLSHGTTLYVVDSEGYMRLAYSAAFDPQELANDLRLLMGAFAGVPTVPFGTY